MKRFSKSIFFVIGTVFSLTVLPMTAKAADYTVVKDDSLYKISVVFKTTVNTIKSVLLL